MQYTGADVTRELIKLEMLQEQLALEEQNLIDAKFQLQRAEIDLTSVAQKIQCHQLEFDALVSLSWSLKRGRVGTGFTPRPTVYAPLEGIPMELTYGNHTVLPLLLAIPSL